MGRSTLKIFRAENTFISEWESNYENTIRPFTLPSFVIFPLKFLIWTSFDWLIDWLIDWRYPSFLDLFFFGTLFSPYVLPILHIDRPVLALINRARFFLSLRSLSACLFKDTHTHTHNTHTCTESCLLAFLWIWNLFILLNFEECFFHFFRCWNVFFFFDSHVTRCLLWRYFLFGAFFTLFTVRLCCINIHQRKTFGCASLKCLFLTTKLHTIRGWRIRTRTLFENKTTWLVQKTPF